MHTVIITPARARQLYGHVGSWLGASTTETYHEIIAWCDANVVGNYHIDNINRWLFEQEQDALLFRLTWC